MSFININIKPKTNLFEHLVNFSRVATEFPEAERPFGVFE